MPTIILITGLFLGIGVFLATMYSLTQILLLEGRGRIAHALVFGAALAIMSALFFWESVPAARLLALPLLGAAVWAFTIERRWFRIFPVILQVFAAVLISGYVAVSPVGA